MGNQSRSTRNDGVRAEYADWLRIPKSDRFKIAGCPKTKKEFSEKWDVSTVALWKWEQDTDFRTLVHTRAMGTILSTDETERVIAALKQRAYEGNISAIKLLLDVVGLLEKQKAEEPEEEQIDFSKLSEDELSKFLREDDGEDE